MSPIASGKTFSLVLLLDFLVFSLFFLFFSQCHPVLVKLLSFFVFGRPWIVCSVVRTVSFSVTEQFFLFFFFFFTKFRAPSSRNGRPWNAAQTFGNRFFVSFYFFARLKLPSLLNRVLFFCFIFLPFSASPQRYFTHFFLFRQLHVWPWKSRGTGYPVRYRVSFCAVIVTDIGGRSSDVCYRVVLPSFFLWLIFFLHLWKESCPWKDHLFFSLREIVVSLDMNEPTVAFETKITVLSFFILIWKKTTKNNPNGKKRST